MMLPSDEDLQSPATPRRGLAVVRQRLSAEMDAVEFLRSVSVVILSRSRNIAGLPCRCCSCVGVVTQNLRDCVFVPASRSNSI
jgi:hypothetical protein